MESIVVINTVFKELRLAPWKIDTIFSRWY